MLREQMGEEMALTLEELGVTSIMVTHDPEEALTLADRIVLMNDGEVIQTGTPDELFQSPSNVFSARFSSAGSTRSMGLSTAVPSKPISVDSESCADRRIRG